MSRTHHPRRTPSKSIRGNAGDVGFHIDNALRSVNKLLAQVRERDTYEQANELRTTLLAAKARAERLRLQARAEAQRADDARKRRDAA